MPSPALLPRAWVKGEGPKGEHETGAGSFSSLVIRRRPCLSCLGQWSPRPRPYPPSWEGVASAAHSTPQGLAAFVLLTAPLGNLNRR